MSWFLQSVYDGEADVQCSSLMTPNFVTWTWCILRKAGIRVQKIRDLIHELHLHDEKIGVWCAMSARREISTISGQKLHRINKIFRRHTDCFRSARQYYQHMLDFLNVIIIANFFLTFIDDCQASRASTYDVTLADVGLALIVQGRKTMTLYNWYQVYFQRNSSFRDSFL